MCNACVSLFKLKIEINVKKMAIHVYPANIALNNKSIEIKLRWSNNFKIVKAYLRANNKEHLWQVSYK